MSERVIHVGPLERVQAKSFNRTPSTRIVLGSLDRSSLVLSCVWVRVCVCWPPRDITNPALHPTLLLITVSVSMRSVMRCLVHSVSVPSPLPILTYLNCVWSVNFSLVAFAESHCGWCAWLALSACAKDRARHAETDTEADREKETYLIAG